MVIINNPNISSISFGNEDTTIRFADGIVLRLPKKNITDILVSKNGTRVAAFEMNGNISIWDVDDINIKLLYKLDKSTSLLDISNYLTPSTEEES
jgi:hypothetical protein